MWRQAQARPRTQPGLPGSSWLPPWLREQTWPSLQEMTLMFQVKPAGPLPEVTLGQLPTLAALLAKGV